MSQNHLLNKVWLSSPTMHGDALRYMRKVYETNRMSAVDANINKADCRHRCGP